MRSRSLARNLLALVAVLLAGSLAFGDRLTLKDGSVLQGKVIRKSDGYWVKLADGTTQTIDASDVTKYEKTGATDADSGGAAASARPSKPAGATSTALAVVRRKAESVETPDAAVDLWQQFIDTKPSADDLHVANNELEKWKKLAEGHAEKIKGRWVSGSELEDLKTRMHKIREEFDALIKTNSTVAAIKKLEEMEAIYPDSYELNWTLGYFSLIQHQPDKAINYFDRSSKLCPRLMVAYGNWGVALVTQGKTMEAIAKFQQAAQISDCPELAQDLRNALMLVPANQRSGNRIKEALATDGILANKYPPAVAAKGFVYLPYIEPKRSLASGGGDENDQPAEWAGTGFLIDDSGLILTNRHVAAGAKSLTVILNGGEKKTAEVVAIDDEQDLALIRVKTDAATPYLIFSSHDQPAEGADCTVMGYPLYGRLGTNIKVTRGIVTGIEPGELGADVLVDAKVNPGNSGGPMLDKHGNVMAIVSMKTRSNATEDTYGIGLSAGHVRKFLSKHHVALVSSEDAGTPLDAEAIVARVKPAAVCILGRK